MVVFEFTFSVVALPSHTLLRLIDVGASKKFQSKPRNFTTPTLTKARAYGGGFYLTKLNRSLSPKDSWQIGSKEPFKFCTFYTC